ncbi:putative ankyrin repeat protein [Megavirus vitis]|nr:putative ankyrin repeat protein [Megavirus vitis]
MGNFFSNNSDYHRYSNSMTPMIDLILMEHDKPDRIINFAKLYPEKVNDYSMLGFNALMYACTSNKKIEIVKILLDHGANVNAHAKCVNLSRGTTALMIASTCKRYEDELVCPNIETVQLLLNHGANINSVDSDGNTAFLLACRDADICDNYDIVKLLIDSGSNIKAINSKKQTALSILESYEPNNNINLIKKLLI